MDSTGSHLVQHLPIPLLTYFFKDLFYFRHIQNLLVRTGHSSERDILLPFWNKASYYLDRKCSLEQVSSQIYHCGKETTKQRVQHSLSGVWFWESEKFCMVRKFARQKLETSISHHFQQRLSLKYVLSSVCSRATKMIFSETTIIKPLYNSQFEVMTLSSGCFLGLLPASAHDLFTHTPAGKHHLVIRQTLGKYGPIVERERFIISDYSLDWRNVTK